MRDGHSRGPRNDGERRCLPPRARSLFLAVQLRGAGGVLFLVHRNSFGADAEFEFCSFVSGKSVKPPVFLFVGFGWNDSDVFLACEPIALFGLHFFSLGLDLFVLCF